MEKKLYGTPEIDISSVECDVITASYIEGEEWTGPEVVGEDLFG